MSLAVRIFRKNWWQKVFKRYFLPQGWKYKPFIENSQRFYPADIERHEKEPTKEQFAIVQNGEFGEGVISKTSFPADSLLFRFSGQILSYQTLFTLQKEHGKYIEDPYFMGKILHSCNPNAYVDMEKLEFWAIKEIHPGDFITMDYETTEDELFRSFQCACGAANCRGKIVGKLSGSKNTLSDVR